MTKKQATKAEKAYKEYVRSLPCAVTGYIGEMIDPHHIKGYAWITGACGSSKGHYLTCIPLRHDYHMEFHQIGWSSFEDKYNISQLETMILTMLQAEKDGVITINTEIKI